MRRLPRVPLPGKLLISYLLVVAIGAIPVFLYLQARTFERLTSDAAQTLLERAQLVARVLTPMSPEERLSRVAEVAQVSTERVTYIASNGLVLFDSAMPVERMENHLQRPEVLMALGRIPFEGPLGEERSGGVGVARRISITVQRELLYVAVVVPGAVADGASPELLRLSRPVAEIRATTNDALVFARNSQGLSISMAILLSVLSSALFARPLQQLVKVAETMATGDLNVTVRRQANDELGDVARALEQLALQLRRRLASSRSGEAMLAQLADALPLPLVVLETDGELVSINGPGRRALHLGAVELGEKVESLVAQRSFGKALARAELEGEPESLHLHVNGVGVPCVLHVLKRPGTAPLCVILGGGPGGMETGLPSPEDVTSIPLARLMSEVESAVAGLTETTHLRIELPASAPDVRIAEVEGRFGWGLILLALTASRGAFVALAPELEVEPTHLHLELPGLFPAGELLKLLRRLWEPVGGGVRQGEHALELRLPLA